MLRFTTITPIYCEDSSSYTSSVKPLVTPPRDSKLMGGSLRGVEAFIVGDALRLAGFNLPCFFDGDITELDKKTPNVVMVLPSGTYPIDVLFKDGIYYLDLKTD